MCAGVMCASSACESELVVCMRGSVFVPERVCVSKYTLATCVSVCQYPMCVCMRRIWWFVGCVCLCVCVSERE